MKRTICLVLAALLFCLAGCEEPKPSIQVPVKYYYPYTEITYGSDGSVIGFEERESAGFETDWIYLLEQYFSGPDDSRLVSPFPPNLKVVSLQTRGEIVSVEVSTELGQLSGIHLTIACTCMAKTVLEMTGARKVQISAEGTLLDGRIFLVLDNDSLLLTDDSAQITEPSPTDTSGGDSSRSE